MYLQNGYFLVTTIPEERKYDLNVSIVVKNLLLDIPTNQVIHEEKKYDLNVNIVIKKLLLDVPAKQVLSSDYYSQGKEI